MDHLEALLSSLLVLTRSLLHELCWPPGNLYSWRPRVPVSETVRGASPEPQAQAELEAIRTALASEYDVVEELGRGGMAVVYLARDRQLDREVALKALPRNLVHDAGLVERFQREARIAAQLEHPHIVPIYRVGRQGDVIYFAMKHLRGGSLASLLNRQRQLTTAEVRRILLEVADALECAGSRHIVHRDIKPENILFDEAGRCVVTDFGIAKSAADTQLTGSGQSIGTPHYMSPEQARGAGTDGRSDLYSLGVLAYRCLSGKVPFDGPDNLAILYAQVTTSLPLPVLPSAEHEALYRVIRRLTAKQPANRLPSGRELIRLLNRDPSAVTSGPATVPVDTVPATTTGPSQSVPATVTAPPAILPPALHFLEKRKKRVAVLALGFVASVLVAWSMAGLAGGGRSLCPVAGDSANFLLLLDPIPARVTGSDLEVFYDVCGLASGTPYSSRLRLSKRDEGLKKLLGKGSKPLVTILQERAEGPAVRRSRTLDLESVRPGSYTLELLVTDNRGRARRRTQTVQVTIK